MNFFVCLVRVSGAPIRVADRRLIESHLRSRGIDYGDWEGSGSFLALARRTGRHGPQVLRIGVVSGVGHVRLDNPSEIARCLPGAATADPHLGLVLRATVLRGGLAVERLLGDFAYVAWDPAERRLLAVRDAFGVRQLFYAALGEDLFGFSSHASLLGLRGPSREYITKYFVRSLTDEDTIFESVRVVPAAHTMCVAGGRSVVEPYWSTDRFDTDLSLSGPDVVEEFRSVLAEAVRLRIGSQGSTWSELSGGLDTSSIVSTSDWLDRSSAVGRRLAGTITFADSMGTGDESDYVNAVVEATGVRNEQFRECWPWKDDGGLPLRTESPGPVTFFWARERWRSTLLRETGAEVLLSGFGGDHVLEGNLYYFADWLAHGSARRACTEMARWAALERVSFWKFAFAHGVMPLLPTAVRSQLTVGSRPRIPTWIARTARERMEAYVRDGRIPQPRTGVLPWYRRENVLLVQCFARSLPRTTPTLTYERRYPFLYRPLVELSLRLPPSMKRRPGERKVALREAMRGVLPERVRTRLGDGGIGSRMLWSLNHERRRIESMLRDPVLAQLGYIDAENLRKAYHEARTGTSRVTVPLFSTLALETWLRIEAGRWPLPEGVRTSSRNRKENSHGEHQAALPSAGTR